MFAATLTEFTVEPRPGHSPFPHHRLAGDAQNLGSLFHAHSAEIAKLDHTSFAWVDDGQFCECLVERDQIYRASINRNDHLIERKFDHPGAPFVPPKPLGMVNQYPAHHLRWD